MQIESTIKRPGGSKIDLGGTTYHFQPKSKEEGEPHVCEVTERKHIERFLEIKEAYRTVSAGNVPVKPSGAPNENAPSPMLIKDAAGREVDLGTMKKADLVEFATKEGFTIESDAKVQDIRDAIVSQVKAEA